MFLPNPENLGEFIKNISDVSHMAVGGQKIVFKANHGEYGEVVIKLIQESMTDERVEREIEVATKFQLPNVAKLYEWGEIIHGDDKARYLIEEYVRGETLRKVLAEKGKIPLHTGLELLRCLLITAVELEIHNLVHRDIKPENIIVKEFGGFCLLDFGIARHLDKPSITMTGAHFGPHTPGYAAPEQFRNLKKEIDIRADLFSIGVVIYEALSGKHPFAEGALHPLDILHRTETLTPKPFIILGDSQKQLAGFIGVMMDKFPSRRPDSAKTALAWFQALVPTIIQGE